MMILPPGPRTPFPGIPEAIPGAKAFAPPYNRATRTLMRAPSGTPKTAQRTTCLRAGGNLVNAMLAFSRAVDALNERIGRIFYWLVLVAVLISSGNAIVRKAFDMSSNAYLEIQWYLFSAVFLMCAGYTLLRNEHIRIDIVAGRFSRRTQTWIDVFGTIFFLFPMVALILYESWPWFVRTFESGEVSPSAGGLILWPAKIFVPVGFALLGLQGISELFKRIAFLAGAGPDPGIKKEAKTAEEELAEEILRQREREMRA